MSEYSKTPIYRASKGKGIRPSKSGRTVNRGTIYIQSHIKLVSGGENRGLVNQGFTVACSLNQRDSFIDARNMGFTVDCKHKRP